MGSEMCIRDSGKRDAVGEREQGTDGTEKWIADSGATFHMTRSADLLRDV